MIKICISKFAVLIVGVTAILASEAHVLAQKDGVSELPKGYLEVQTFVKDKLIGKALETSVNAKIDHNKHGKSETEFFRRELYMNYFEGNDEKAGVGFGYDVLMIIEQNIWPLDESGARTGECIKNHSSYVFRSAFEPSFAIDGALGTQTVVTATSGVRINTAIQNLRATLDDDRLKVVADRDLYDGPLIKGTRLAKAFQTSTVYFFEGDDFKAESKEQSFKVDVETGERSVGEHSVELSSRSIDGLLAPRD